MEYYEHNLDPVGVLPTWFDAPSDGSWGYCRNDIWITAHTSPASAPSGITAIRIPTDHWAVPALKQGFIPWPGGEKAPDDWDEGEVFTRVGYVTRTASLATGWRDGSIIGYRRKQPTEAQPSLSEGVTPELVERMVRYIKWDSGSPCGRGEVARAILAEYEAATKPPVDPLVEVIREAIDTSDVGAVAPSDFDFGRRDGLRFLVAFHDALGKRGGRVVFDQAPAS